METAQLIEERQGALEMSLTPDMVIVRFQAFEAYLKIRWFGDI
jgi:hypothetical protein